jgi:branched-chain amino acid transport system substrate-binding protein
MIVMVAAMVVVAAACGGSTTSSNTGSNTGGTNPPSSQADPAALLGPANKATGSAVKVGVISDGKSPASDQSYELDVVSATASYLDEHQGGLAGHEIQLVTCVDEGDPAKATDCANQLVKDQVAVVLTGELQAGENIFQPLHDAAIPVVWYAAGSAKVILDKDSSFMLASATGGLVDLPIAAAKAAGKSKVTVVLIDVPAATAIYETLGKQLFADAGIGLDIVKIPPGTADMTPQMQTLASGDPGNVHILGTDAFCISALKGLQAVGYDGPRSMVSQCLSDATRKAIPAADLAGIKVATSAPIGTDDPGIQLFDAIMATYAPTVPVQKVGAVSMYQTLASLAVVLDGHTGDLTPATITAAIKGAPQKPIPASGGIGFRCNGKASSFAPAVCSKGSLATTLGDDGGPTTYQVLNNGPID